MIVVPKIRGFICTTAHPAGCAAHVRGQIAYVSGLPKAAGPKKALVIGASTGYGLASRIALAYGCGAATLGVALERPASGSRTATAGWYNTAAFERFAAADGLYAKTVMGDAFSSQIKEKTAALIRRELGQVDAVIYSLAAPRRTAPDGVTYASALKPIGTPYTSKALDLSTGAVINASIEPAVEAEIEGTRRVMGGEDWLLWLEMLDREGLLAPGAVTLAYSYIGPDVTHAIYRDGTVGRAKQDLERTSGEIGRLLAKTGGRSYVSVNKAVVTQASAAIPAVPLYTSILFKIMKQKGIHEDCIEQMRRLFCDKLASGVPETDEGGRIRMDDLEMRRDVQKQVEESWRIVDTDNLGELGDLEGYWSDFRKLFGFDQPGVDYDADVETDLPLPSQEND